MKTEGKVVILNGADGSTFILEVLDWADGRSASGKFTFSAFIKGSVTQSSGTIDVDGSYALFTIRTQNTGGNVYSEMDFYIPPKYLNLDLTPLQTLVLCLEAYSPDPISAVFQQSLSHGKTPCDEIGEPLDVMQEYGLYGYEFACRKVMARILESLGLSNVQFVEVGNLLRVFEGSLAAEDPFDDGFDYLLGDDAYGLYEEDEGEYDVEADAESLSVWEDEPTPRFKEIAFTPPASKLYFDSDIPAREVHVEDHRTNPDGTSTGRTEVKAMAKGPERFEQLAFARDPDGGAYDGIAVETWRTWHEQFRGNGDHRHKFYEFSWRDEEDTEGASANVEQEEKEWEWWWQEQDVSEQQVSDPEDASSDQQSA